MNKTKTINWFTSISSNSKPGLMAMVRSYLAGFWPGTEERKESLTAQAPSTISSTPGLSHVGVLWIQPLLNKLCVSADRVGFSDASPSSHTRGLWGGQEDAGRIPPRPGEWAYTSSARWGRIGATDLVTPSRILSKTVWHDCLPSESSGSQYNLNRMETERSWECETWMSWMRLGGQAVDGQFPATTWI